MNAIPGFDQRLRAVVGDLFDRGFMEWLRNLVARLNIVSPRVGDLRVSTDPTARDGEIEADGTDVSRSTYAAYFDLVGVTYGAGNGSTTFTLPYLSTTGSEMHYFVRVD